MPGTLAVTLAWMVAGCGSESPRPADGGAQGVTSASMPAAPEEAEAVAVEARPVATALMTALSGRLQEAIRERGAAGALEFCNVEALPLTAQVAREQGMEVTRTSLRLRNPANAPDAVDAEALGWFQERLDAGEAFPGMHVRRLEGGGYPHYQPLITAGLCLQCHGARESLTADVQQALDQRYPEDRAVGYAEGEWRGLLRVSLPGDPGAAP